MSSYWKEGDIFTLSEADEVKLDIIMNKNLPLKTVRHLLKEVLKNSYSGSAEV